LILKKNATESNKKLERKEDNKMELNEFIETFSNREKINNFTQKISNCGKFQLDGCQVLGSFYKVKI